MDRYILLEAAKFERNGKSALLVKFSKRIPDSYEIDYFAIPYIRLVKMIEMTDKVNKNISLKNK